MNEMDAQLMALVASGDMEVTGVNADGETMYRLTEQGQARALNLISGQRWAREVVNQLGGNIAEPPKDAQ